MYPNFLDRLVFLQSSRLATSMYNTRRAAYMNSCSTAMELPSQNLHQNWQDTEYVGTTCSNEANDCDIPGYNNDKEDEQYYPEEKKTSRKRANTTSSGGGNEKESKRTANKICRVCGDKAFSYNFNVITCESCKAFFRRNANKEKEIRCPFNEQCEINMVSRRFCQRCRLAKCFTVGMKKEWIMSEEARLEKKQRVEENRERRLQDALNRAMEEANMEEDSENSYDEAPGGQPKVSVRQYLVSEDSNSQPPQPQEQIPEDLHPHGAHHSYNLSDEKMMNYYQDGPSDLGYSAHEYDCSQQPASNSSVPLESAESQVDTTTSDPGASSSNTSMTFADESKLIPTSVFLPASISAIQDVAAIISQGESTTLGMCHSDMVDGSFINAAVQAQAVINHTQQLAAAVVAQQVVSQIAPVIPAVAPLDPLLAPALAIAAAPTISAAPTMPIPVPINPGPIGIPIIPKEMPVSVSLLTQLEQSAADMVTVSKDMLVKLIQNSNRTTCTCTCVCGRYPPGSTIVDEVTKDLLNSGSSNSSSAEKDETRLETTEDMQMNGLLPGESNSSIHWLSQQSSAQAVVDPINHSLSAEEENTQRERRDSIFGAFSSAAEQTPATPQKSMQEETFWEHTVAENESRELSDEEVEKMEELNEISKSWNGAGYDSVPILELFKEENVKIIVNNLKLLSSFRFLQKRDKRAVIKRGLFNYCVVKWMQHKESMILEGLHESVIRDFMKLVKKDEFNYRVQPGAFNALAISAMFHCSSENLISTEVYMEHIIFKKLLDKTLPIKVSSDMMYNNYFPDISAAAQHLELITGGIPDSLIRALIS
uniref:Nuclear receptor domain-containing protein n=1 Tax=Caenorhabditis japonica TaxID=281687 RepID=A0A8R1DIX8_CAEJA